MEKIRVVEKKAVRLEAVNEEVAGSYNKVYGYGESPVEKGNPKPENSPIIEQLVEKYRCVIKWWNFRK
ncbi:MAG: hypothetical protein KAS51_01205 [Candidatus Omnitrophica bacterium]|nr:hypothetical protein [Candidatus Omnitrophota bacterium]